MLSTTKGKIAHSQALRDSAPAGAGRVTYAKVLKNALKSTKQPSIKSFFKAKDIRGPGCGEGDR